MSPREEHNQVTIIVVNWNGERFLKDCLSALSNQSYANCEIILVDNGSADNSIRFTREKFPAVKIVALKENKGFTGGNVAGLEVAQGAYIALVNNDARPDRAWLENLLQPMLRDRTIGLCASKLIFENIQTVKVPAMASRPQESDSIAGWAKIFSMSTHLNWCLAPAGRPPYIAGVFEYRAAPTASALVGVGMTKNRTAVCRELD